MIAGYHNKSKILPVIMKYLILIRCIAAAAEQPAGCPAATEPFSYGEICSVCRTEAFGANTCTGDIWSDANAYFSSGKCQRCGHNTIHLGCALGSLQQINCYNCGEAVCHGFRELDELVKNVRNGCAELISHRICNSALNGLESMEHSLMVLTLRSYDMTVDELGWLENYVKNAGTCYPNTVRMINHSMWIKSVAYMPFWEVLAMAADAPTLGVVLPILGILITPQMVARAKEGQIIAAINSLASYKGCCASVCSALVKKSLILLIL